MDYTLIEIFYYDNIRNFCPIRIDPDYVDDYYKNQVVFILQYPRGNNELKVSIG